MKISVILIIVLFIIALLGSIGGTSYYYTQCNKAMTTQVFKDLESVAQSKASHIETVLKMYEQRARLLTSKTWLRKHLKSYLETGDEEYKTKVEQILIDVQKENSEFLHISIINLDGKIIISTEEQQYGKDVSERVVFIKGKEDYFISDILKGDISSVRRVIAGPLIQDGELLGVIVVGSGGKSLEKVMIDKTGMGETGETYLINKEGYAITPLLFVENAVLEWKVDTVNSRNCFSHAGHEGNEEPHEEHHGHEAVQVFLDYRGEKVIGAHVYIPEMQWCLLAEIDEEEILGNQRAIFQRVSLTIIIVITILVTLMGFFLGRFIDKRIVLKKGVKSL